MNDTMREAQSALVAVVLYPPDGNIVQRLPMRCFFGKADPTLGGRPQH